MKPFAVLRRGSRITEEPSLNRLLAGEEITATTVRTQSWAGLIGAQKSIDDLAALLVRARGVLRGDSVEVSNHLEMAEMDLLSARDAIEKACWDINSTVQRTALTNSSQYNNISVGVSNTLVRISLSSTNETMLFLMHRIFVVCWVTVARIH